MPNYMRCCSQAGGCTGSLFDNAFGAACNASGGYLQIKNMENLFGLSVCDLFEAYGELPCNHQGVCNYPSPTFNQCLVTNIATCLKSLIGSFTPGLQVCPAQPFTQVEMFPYRHRAFPYHSNFLAAWKGKDQLGVPVFKKHAFLQWWHSGQYGFDQQPKMQPGRLVLERVFGCRNPDTNRQIHAATTKVTCENEYQGLWQWTGRLKSTPSIVVNISTVEDCNKYAGDDGSNFRKLQIIYGFWFPKQKFCCDEDTLEMFPQYKTQGECEAWGKYWQTPTTGSIIRPPQWRAAYRSGPNPLGATTGQRIQTNYNHQGSSEYVWMIYMPVTPLDELDPACCTGPTPCVPYCNEPDAPDRFPLFDPRTYEIPNYPRESQEGSGFPYVNNYQLGTGSNPSIPAGLRAMIGHSPGDARNANLDAYCDHAFPFGCPGGGSSGCEYDFCWDAHENVMRKYRAYSAQRKYEWTDDPEERGWWVSYWAEMDAWFVQDSWWVDLIDQRPPQRWSTWYTGKIGCRFHGDASDGDFRAWILSHDSGFGVDFGPRYTANCNDALLRYASLPSALADAIYPSVQAQETCKDPEAAGGFPPSVLPPPCKRAGFGYSKWYRPDWGAPLPEQLLIHETTRKRYTNPEKTTFQTQLGWAQIGYSTVVPCIVQGPPL